MADKSTLRTSNLVRSITIRAIYFVKSLITSIWIHNGLEHILFFSIVGVLIVSQSFEAKYGTRMTTLIFFMSHILIGITFAILFNAGHWIWPNETFFSFGFNRNWMGGSVTFYGIIGTFSYFNSRTWFLLVLMVCFELINHFVINTNIYISMVHLTSLGFGWLIAKVAS